MVWTYLGQLLVDGGDSGLMALDREGKGRLLTDGGL